MQDNLHAQRSFFAHGCALTGESREYVRIVGRNIAITFIVAYGSIGKPHRTVQRITENNKSEKPGTNAQFVRSSCHILPPLDGKVEFTQ